MLLLLFLRVKRPSSRNTPRCTRSAHNVHYVIIRQATTPPGTIRAHAHHPPVGRSGPEEVRVCRGHLEAAGAETRDPAYRQLLAKPVASEQVAAGPPTHTDNLKPRPSIPSTEGLDVIVGAYIRDRSPVVLSRVQTRTWFDPRCHLCGTDSVAQQSSSTAVNRPENPGGSLV